MTLLREHTTYDSARMIVESAEDNPHGGKSLYMKGIFIQGGVKNRNQRVYPIHEIQRAVNALNEMIKEGPVLGELDHPEELNINLDRVSHMITEMYMDGNNGIGKLKILNTPMGNIAKALIQDGVKLGVSSRGSGNVNNIGNVTDFEIVTVDLVATPSAPNAVPLPLWESLNGKRGAITEDLAKAAQEDSRAQEFLRDELVNFIRLLK